MVIAFENESNREVHAIVGRAYGMSYHELRAYIGAPGSLVREAPEGFIETGFLSADAGASTIGAVDVDVGTWALVCIVDARAGAARVWPGGSFSVRSTR